MFGIPEYSTAEDPFIKFIGWEENSSDYPQNTDIKHERIFNNKLVSNVLIK